MECLWHLTAREAPRGDIGKLSDEDIALALDYRGDESVLIGALISCGWIDESEFDRLVIHDWADHADDSVHMKIARTNQYFVRTDGDFVRPKTGRLPQKERESADNWYSVHTPCARKPIPCAQKSVLCASLALALALPLPQPQPTNGAPPLPVELRPQTEYPETLRVIREHDASCDPFFVQRLADESARQIISDPVAQNWTMEKQRKAVSDPVLAKCCREVYATPRKKPPGTGLLLVTVPRILIGGKLNYV